ncbi:MAG: shikimate kinase [Cyanobacteriota bacterium]|nr:shikimate kinase [Cyanobacteriota bacterium]
MTALESFDLARRLQGLNLYLVGMMGAGKSAVGRPLAQALGYRFIDADTTLEETAGRTISDIFAEAGEEGFRALESAVLNELSRWHSLVVATGGGVVTRPVNWGQLQQGVVIWLDAPETILLQRLQGDPTPRPLLADPDPAGRLRDLLAERRPLYAQADLHVMQQGESPEALAGRVLEALPTILKREHQPPGEPIRLLHGDGHTSDNLNG